jgi:isopenicillin-N N-acyltransferase-like protein
VCVCVWLQDTVYNGMDWLCPGYNQVLGEQLAKFHGSIDENVIVHDILPTTQTGNLHIAVYDLTVSNMHVSFARPSTAPSTEPLNAYERTFTRLHMEDIFAETAPTEW